MLNRILVLVAIAMSIGSIAIAVRTQQTLQAFVDHPVASPDSVALETLQQRLHAMEARLAGIATRLGSMETRPDATPTAVSAPSNASLDAIDANIESLLQSTAQNTRDVQKANKQIRELVQQCQSAFSRVAAEIGTLRGELKKISATNAN